MLCVDNKKEQTELKATNIISLFHPFFFFFFGSKRQGVISAFLKRQGVTKKGQGVAPCKNGLGRTLYSTGSCGWNCLWSVV